MAAEVNADWAVELIGECLVTHDLEIIARHAERKGHTGMADVIRALKHTTFRG